MSTARHTTTLAVLLAALVACLPIATAATGTPGPFAGTVGPGETDAHAFDNNPTGSPCPAILASYTVTLAYQPATDVLTLSVGGASVDGQAGLAQLTLTASWCTNFTIGVTGTDVAAQAAYTVSVVRTTGAPGGSPWA